MNSTRTRPFGGTSTVFVCTVLPFTASVTFFFAASVSYPRMVAANRTFFGSVTDPGADTVSTAQFGCFPLDTRCGTSVADSGSCISMKLDGCPDFWKSLARWTSKGFFTDDASVFKYRAKSP